MTDHDAQQIQRAIGRLEGKIDGFMSDIQDIKVNCINKTSEIHTDTGNIWSAISRQGERLIVVETKLTDIAAEAVKGGAKGGGVVAGIGIGLLLIAIAFFKYGLPAIHALMNG